MMMRAPLPATASAFPGPGGGGGGGSGIGGGGGQAGSNLRGVNPSRIHAAVPALAPQQRTVVLQRILKDQATFLATQSTPSADLGSGWGGGKGGKRKTLVGKNRCMFHNRRGRGVAQS